MISLRSSIIYLSLIFLLLLHVHVSAFIRAQVSSMLAVNNTSIPDTDGDGINNKLDNDIDADGIDNDNDDDIDSDGMGNATDNDDDGDGDDDKDDDDDDSDGVDDNDDDDNIGNNPSTTPGAPTGQPTITSAPTGNVTPTPPPPTGTATGVGFQFVPITETNSVGGKVTLAILIHTLSEKTVGAEAQVRYDPTMLQVSNVTTADFYPSITTTDTAGILLARGSIEQPADFRSGSGRMATVEFTTLKQGSTTLTFFCDLAQFNSSKIIKNDINASNIINCAANNTYTVTIGTGALTPTTAVTPAAYSNIGSSFNKNAAFFAATALVLLIIAVVLINV